MTQTQLGEQLDRHYRIIQNYEKGRMAIPTAIALAMRGLVAAAATPEDLAVAHAVEPYVGSDLVAWRMEPGPRLKHWLEDHEARFEVRVQHEDRVRRLVPTIVCADEETTSMAKLMFGQSIAILNQTSAKDGVG